MSPLLSDGTHLTAAGLHRRPPTSLPLSTRCKNCRRWSCFCPADPPPLLLCPQHVSLLPKNGLHYNPCPACTSGTPSPSLISSEFVLTHAVIHSYCGWAVREEVIPYLLLGCASVGMLQMPPCNVAILFDVPSSLLPPPVTVFPSVSQSYV